MMIYDESSPEANSKRLHLPAKITFGEMRASDVRDVRVNCRDHRYSRHVEISADRWPDHVRLSDFEPDFVCITCERGAEVRPTFLTRAWVPVSAVVTGHSRPLARAPSGPQVPPSAAREKVSGPRSIERDCAVPLPCLRRQRR